MDTYLVNDFDEIIAKYFFRTIADRVSNLTPPRWGRSRAAQISAWRNRAGRHQLFFVFVMFFIFVFFEAFIYKKFSVVV